MHRHSSIAVGIGVGVLSLPALLALLGCCNARTLTQSGLVPFSEPDPPPTSHGSADVYAAGSGLTHLDATGAATSGDYVPAGQLHVGAMFRPVGGLMIRPMGMLAFADGAGSVGTGSTLGAAGAPGVRLDAPSTQSFALGFDVGYMLGDESRDYVFRPHVGVSALGIGARVSDPATSPFTSELGWMAVIAGGLDLGTWVTPWLLLMGSVDLRNMPDLPSSVTACVGQTPPFVSFGAFTVTTRVSAEVEITDGFSVFAGVAFPTYGSTYSAYPIVTGGVRGSFGDGRLGLVRHRPNQDPSQQDTLRRAPDWGR
jgi:hypothetical protein